LSNYHGKRGRCLQKTKSWSSAPRTDEGPPTKKIGARGKGGKSNRARFKEIESSMAGESNGDHQSKETRFLRGAKRKEALC